MVCRNRLYRKPIMWEKVSIFHFAPVYFNSLLRFMYLHLECLIVLSDESIIVFNVPKVMNDGNGVVNLPPNIK
jgi:hypothetical protein